MFLNYVSEDLVALIVGMTTSRDCENGAVKRDGVSALTKEDRNIGFLRRKIFNLLLPLFELCEVLRVPARHIKKDVHVELLEWFLLGSGNDLGFSDVSHRILSLLKERNAGLEFAIDLDLDHRCVILQRDTCCSTDSLVNEFLQELVITVNFDRELKHRNAFLCGFTSEDPS